MTEKPGNGPEAAQAGLGHPIYFEGGGIMAQAASYKALLKTYNNSSSSIKWYFSQFPNLLISYPYEITIAYLFLYTERAHNRALYCGVVKLHRADINVADNVINANHLTRDGFSAMYKNIFGVALPKSTRDLIKRAEKVRDKVIHGKDVADSEMREAISDVFKYAESLNRDIKKVAAFEPFGNVRGFKGKAQSLDKKTTRWLLKGLGFSVS